MNDLDKKLDDAINTNNLNEVSDLLNKGANIEYRDEFGCTALMCAAWIASTEIVEFLLLKGADKKATNNDGLTALQMIQSIGHNNYGHDAVIEILKG